MEINSPEVLAELARLHELYERALIDNDVSTLEALFWDSPHAIRYGVMENLYGIDEVRAFRRARPSINLARTIERLEITTFGDSAGVVNLHFTRFIDGIKRQGRQSQHWMKLSEGWRIVSAHVSFIPMALSYVDTASAMVSLPISPQDRGSVEEEFRRISSVAQVLLQFPLDQSVEAAPIFQP